MDIKSCVYCGDWFQCRDHVIPVSWQQVYRNYRRGDTVPCCTMCNTLAGSFMAESVGEKAHYLIGRYERKYKKILALPKWNKEELKELGNGLRCKVQANENLRELIRLKIVNLNLVANGFEPTPFRKDIIKLEERRKKRISIQLNEKEESKDLIADLVDTPLELLSKKQLREYIKDLRKAQRELD